MTPKSVPHRTRAGTFKSFEKRYGIIDPPSGEVMRPWDDPDVLACFDKGRDDGHRYVWTVVEGGWDNYAYVVPGFATVNFMGRVLCRRPWPDEEMSLPGYKW